MKQLATFDQGYYFAIVTVNILQHKQGSFFLNDEFLQKHVNNYIIIPSLTRVGTITNI